MYILWLLLRFFLFLRKSNYLIFSPLFPRRFLCSLHLCAFLWSLFFVSLPWSLFLFSSSIGILCFSSLVFIHFFFLNHHPLFFFLDDYYLLFFFFLLQIKLFVFIFSSSFPLGSPFFFFFFLLFPLHSWCFIPLLWSWLLETLFPSSGLFGHQFFVSLLLCHVHSQLHSCLQFEFYLY